ncbi:MAG: MBL fold metallo-hydrolase [Alphaproteobacteria bacterium]|jgi:cyclase|nr:MBL fold metallo-hydrolase [Alphaproteobacteria bacterium]MBT4085888.1 MBL fold metallo-hydrolase [Alphaproteobacteria bacterium]MBT4542639.1 MBL fold metallo-hydrolase [Alphaproteobacteria bacterium]MBT6384849.1 MBL fold metallo-hydrolase [Alphaproteobacteria bacterium]MBT7746843.1 MBL fold metallo-hydrolase [Alphaproteobacteria bacterium]
MSKWQYTKGLHDLGQGSFAYLQPDGGWGWSNAGLITDGEESLLVDTLFDLNLTRDMLKTMRDAVPQAENIGTLVNTHANGDHTFGNQLVEGAAIVASAAGAEEMAELPPQALAEIMRNAGAMGEAGEFLKKLFDVFEFDGIDLAAPTETFSGMTTRKVGDKNVELHEVGPAHTKGDTLVYVPGDKTVFTGDILFIEGHPIMWAGPVANWIKACDLMLGWDVETIVPGHGPVTDKAGVEAVRGYLVYIEAEARKRHAAGMSVMEAAQDIAMDDYSSWGDGERIAVNVDTLFKEFNGDTSPPDVVQLFGMMSKLAK